MLVTNPPVPLVGSKNFQTFGSVCNGGRSCGSGNRVSAHVRTENAVHTCCTAASNSVRVAVPPAFKARYWSLAATMSAFESGVQTTLLSPLLAAPVPPGLLLEFQKRMSSSARQPLYANGVAPSQPDNVTTPQSRLRTRSEFGRLELPSRAANWSVLLHHVNEAPWLKMPSSRPIFVPLASTRSHSSPQPSICSANS